MTVTRNHPIETLPVGGPRVFFTADHHFGHRAVVEYCRRPFLNEDEMDHAMIERWNAAVGPGDLVYHLGDFALCAAGRATEIAKQLRGQKYLIFGNHDKQLRKNVEFLGQWIWARDMHQVEVQGQKITLLHFAMLVWNQSHRGAWNLHGHSHGSLADDPKSLRLDVGVDVWSYAPVAFETLRDRMSLKKFEPVDHHKEYR